MSVLLDSFKCGGMCLELNSPHWGLHNFVMWTFWHWDFITSDFFFSRHHSGLWLIKAACRSRQSLLSVTVHTCHCGCSTHRWVHFSVFGPCESMSNKGETGAPRFRIPLSMYTQDSGHINYSCSADLIQAHRQSKQHHYTFIMQYCSLIFFCFAGLGLVCIFALWDSWKDYRFLAVHHVVCALYVFWESRSITEGNIFLITANKFVV